MRDSSSRILLNCFPHDLKSEIGVGLRDAHRRFDAKDVAEEAALSDQQLHLFAILPENDDVIGGIMKQ